MFDKKSSDYLRPFSMAAEARTDALIQAISTLRVEAYRAHAREHPALDRALYLLSLKLSEALANENSHVTKQVSYDQPVGHSTPCAECTANDVGDGCICSCHDDASIVAPTPFDQFVERADAPCLCGAPRNPDGRCSIPDCVQNPDTYLCSAGCGATSDWDHLPECANSINLKERV